jgi:plastocyanin
MGKLHHDPRRRQVIHMRGASIPTASLAIAALALAGCGGGGGGGTTGGGSSAPARTSSGGTSTSGTVAVSMRDIAFVPKLVRAKVGQQVIWTNDDSTVHDVTARAGASFRSSLIDPGGTFSFTPRSAGAIAYVCTIHPGMVGTVIVTR